MGKSLKVKKLQIANFIIYSLIIAILIFMWISGFTSIDLHADSAEEGIGMTFGMIFLIAFLFIFGIIASVFSFIPFVISLINLTRKEMPLIRYHVTFIVFSIIQMVSATIFGFVIVSTNNKIGFIFILILLLCVANLIINSLLIKILKQAEIK